MFQKTKNQSSRKGFTLLAGTLLALVGCLPNGSYAKSYLVTSPDALTKVEITPSDSLRFVLTTPQGAEIKAALAMKLDNADLGLNAKLKKTKKSTVDRIFKPTVPVKHSSIQDCYTDAVLNFGKYDVEFRVYDNAVAYRFITRYPDSVNVMTENFSVVLPQNTMAHLQQPGGWKTSQEERYTHKALKDWNASDRMSLMPALFETPDGEWLMVSESNLRDYAGMYLKGTGSGFNSVFPRSPLKFGDDGDRSVKIVEEAPYLARTSGTRDFPWRYIVFGTASDIASQTMTAQLSDPCQIEDTSWIKPGKTSWEWWNGASVYGEDVDFVSGFNLDTYKYFIDFAADNGIEYILLDEGWAESTMDPYTPNPTVDVKELIRYGNEKNVGIILWLTWLNVDRHPDLFKTLADWGVKGLKIDFMDRTDQWMNDYLERTAAEAAKNHLLVDFHGAHKPAGLDIRYPNVISYEGVRGMEQMGNTDPDNSLWLPFMRNAVGPMDYTPGAMISMQPESYGCDRPNSSSIGTRAYQMALYTAFESGLQMLADSPTMYKRNHDCTEFIADVPVTWDETRVLLAEPGKIYIVAKRKGTDWWLAAMRSDGDKWNEKAVALDFLNPGTTYEAEWFEDGINAPRQAMDYRHRTASVKSGDRITMRLSRNGGWTGHFKASNK